MKRIEINLPRWLRFLKAVLLMCLVLLPLVAGPDKAIAAEQSGVLSEREMTISKTRLWDPTALVDILVYNPHNEAVELPAPYLMPTLEEIYGRGFTEDQFLKQEFSRTSINTVGNNITMTVTYNDSASEGFYDATLGATRRAAFEFGMNRWAANLQGPSIISIVATMSPRGGSATGAVIASCGPSEWSYNFANAPYSETWYADAMAEIISGSDPHPSIQEMSVDFNSDIDNQTVLGSMDFYYGTDGNNGSDIDFITVVIHELNHGLGFLSSFGSDGAWGSGTPNKPVIFDRFLVNGAGTALISLPVSATNVTNNDVFWGGLLGNYANVHDFHGAARARIYAPTTWKGGSSMAHLDESTYTGVWDLETPNYSGGAIHTPDSIVMGILQDIGFSLPYSRYVDILASGFEDGSAGNPFNTVAEGVNSVPSYGFVRIFPGNYAGAITITKPLELLSAGGTAVIK